MSDKERRIHTIVVILQGTMGHPVLGKEVESTSCLSVHLSYSRHDNNFFIFRPSLSLLVHQSEERNGTELVIESAQMKRDSSTVALDP